MARLHRHYDELSTEAKGVNILIESGCLPHVDDAAHRLGTDRMIPRHVFHKLFTVRFSDRSECCTSMCC